jgi:hypothetical protein
MLTNNLGDPRIGGSRESKKSSEQYRTEKITSGGFALLQKPFPVLRPAAAFKEVF